MAGKFCLLSRHIRSVVRNPNDHRLFFATALGPHSSSSVRKYCGGRLVRFSSSMSKEFADFSGWFDTSSGKLPDSADDHTIILICLTEIFDVSFSILKYGERRKGMGEGDPCFLKSLSLMDKEEVKEEYFRLSTRIYLDVKAGNLKAAENFWVLQIIFFSYYFGLKNDAKKVFDFETKDIRNLVSYCRTLSERVPPDVDMEEFRRNSPYERKDLLKFFFKIPDTTSGSGMPEKIAEDYKSSGLSACQEMMKWLCLMVKEGYLEVNWQTYKERADTVDYLLNLCGRLLRDGKLDDLSVLLGPYMEEEDAAVKECTLFVLWRFLEHRNGKVC